MFEQPDWFRDSKFQPINPASPFASPMQAPSLPQVPAAVQPAPMVEQPAAVAPAAALPAPPVGMDPASLQSPPMPTPRPPQSALEAYRASVAPAGGLGNAPMPLARPGGNWDSTTALEGDREMAAKPVDPVGPGHWMPDMSKLQGAIDKNSVIGKLLAMSNAKSGPGAQPQQQAQGLLPQLYSMFGS